MYITSSGFTYLKKSLDNNNKGIKYKFISNEFVFIFLKSSIWGSNSGHHTILNGNDKIVEKSVKHINDSLVEKRTWM